MHTVGWVLGLAFGLYMLWSVYLTIILGRGDARTVGLSYYGLDAAGRAEFKAWLRWHARLLGPLLRFNSRFTKVDFRRARVQQAGTSFPTGSCDAASLTRGIGYAVRPGDVFVATQMKCGTTWMQHVVYEVLHRGHGTLVESGTAMYAVAPWLEGRKSVPVDSAPVLGDERPSRIIKTHLPAHLCPVGPEARFIYVSRHPGSCFASCVDFIVSNVGAMAPGMAAFEEWFRSPDLMWWGTWTDHVKGWWDRSRRDANVLFVTFEAMKRDLPQVVRDVATFLDVKPLTDAELALVVEKCGFDYMQRHQEAFEMHPPHLLQADVAFFRRGTEERHLDVPDDIRRRIVDWAATELGGSEFPLARLYPDVAAASTTGPTRTP